MNDNHDDLVERIMTAIEKLAREGTTERKARFKEALIRLENDPTEIARIDAIAAEAGLESLCVSEELTKPFIEEREESVQAAPRYSEEPEGIYSAVFGIGTGVENGDVSDDPGAIRYEIHHDYHDEVDEPERTVDNEYDGKD